MSVVDTLKDFISTDSGVTVKEYRCTDCEGTFESAKDPDRAACPECLSHDVEVIQERSG